MNTLYLVWKQYQRRAEVIGPMLGAKVVYFPHLFRSRSLRPLDYLVKTVRTIHLLRVARPSLVFVQSPPLYAALAPLILRVPYVVDAHNGVWQSFWGRLPLSKMILRKALAVIVHNKEIRVLAQMQLPDSKLVVIRDPIQPIRWPVSRAPRQVLFICSFDSGEPADLIADVIESMPDYNFAITADVKKLPRHIRSRLTLLPNLTLTGFLNVEQYQRLLCSSAVAVVLEENASIQPSGACEAMASDTPLVTSSSTLTKKLFGDWAWLADHRPAAIAAVIPQAADQRLDLTPYRQLWNCDVNASLTELHDRLAQSGNLS